MVNSIIQNEGNCFVAPKKNLFFMVVQWNLKNIMGNVEVEETITKFKIKLLKYS
jgi:hypothetical protein